MSLLLNKVAVLRLQLYLKKSLAHVFSCEFWKIFKSSLFTEDLQTTASDKTTILEPVWFG